jgi:hypothetical protein
MFSVAVADAAVCAFIRDSGLANTTNTIRNKTPLRIALTSPIGVPERAATIHRKHRPKIQPSCFIKFPLFLLFLFADTAHSDGILRLDATADNPPRGDTRSGESPVAAGRGQ